MICADCIHWIPGDTWGTNPNGTDHGVLVECKGWCLAKPNKRKRWNYCSVAKCKLFDKAKRRGLIMSGEVPITKEQLETLSNFLEEILSE